MKIELSQGFVAVIDDADYDLIAGYSWHVSRKRTGPLYAKANVEIDGRKTTVFMHRLVLGLKPGDPEVDHEDRDGLNNRRANIRPATRTQQMLNRRRWGASGIRGAYVLPSGRYQAQITVDGKKTYLGSFDTAEEAGAAYQAAADGRGGTAR